MQYGTDDTEADRLSRRAFLAAGTAATAGLAGCFGDDGESTPEVISEHEVPGSGAPEVENPPDAVYLPTHEAPVRMLETVRAGEYVLLPHFTTQHQFWLMRGNDDQPALNEPDSPGLHFMFAVWDRETGAMLPVDLGLGMTLRRDGQRVDRRRPWPMISQRMGFHFGDNVPFVESGTYTIEVSVAPVGARKTGGFSGRFEESATTTFTFEFDREIEAQLVGEIEYLDEERWGEPGALEPMGHGGEMDGGMGPGIGLPAPDSYPGTSLGVHTSDGAEFVVRSLSGSRLAEDGDYLFVSPRTPYNRVPLPDMSLSVEGDIQGELTQTIDSELGHHYGLPADLASGDTFDIVVESPPQVARHRGYETAFLDMQPVTVEVDRS